jgi:hypothetical protein
MTSIGAYVFAYCEGLTSVSIPGSVTSIEPSAFQFCRSLTNISVDAESTYYASDDGVLFNYDKTTLIVCPEGKSGDYTIPGSVTSVRREAFRFCFSLINISVDAENRYYASDDGVLFNYDKTTLLVWPAGRKGDYIIPGSATGIGAGAFINCRSLTSVSIPGSVTSIGAYAFGYSQGLTSVSISHGVTSIGKYAFAYCESLTSVSIPGSVTSIGADAFWACQGLSSVSISNGVTSIGEGMFSACRSLTSVTIPGSVTSMGAGAFMGCSKLTDATVGWKTPLAVPADIFENTPIASCTLYVPRGTLERYRAAEVWKTFGTIKETAQDVTVEPVAPADAQPGYIILGLEMPADEAFSGTFYVLLPDGLSLDRANTALFEPLASLYELSVTQESAGLWLLRIAPETLRAAGTTYQEVVKIAYAADESTPAGEYDVVIRDLEFLFAGNTAIRQDEITVRITSRKGDGAGVETAGLQQTEVSVSNRILRVTSASAEQIYVYSASGALLYGAGKAPGTVTCNLGRFPQGVLIVRGSSGWTRKVMLR